jgi:hypothetical protein
METYLLVTVNANLAPMIKIIGYEELQFLSWKVMVATITSPISPRHKMVQCSMIIEGALCGCLATVVGGRRSGLRNDC